MKEGRIEKKEIKTMYVIKKGKKGTGKEIIKWNK